MRFLIKFDSENGSPDPQKSLKFIGFYCVFWILAFLKIRSIFDAILVPTWLHFGRILAILGGSGRLLGRLGGVLGSLGGVLGPSWGVLERLGASWAPLGAS